MIERGRTDVCAKLTHASNISGAQEHNIRLCMSVVSSAFLNGSFSFNSKIKNSCSLIKAAWPLRNIS
jgi:hypothetical protein